MIFTLTLAERNKDKSNNKEKKNKKREQNDKRNRSRRKAPKRGKTAGAKPGESFTSNNNIRTTRVVNKYED